MDHSMMLFCFIFAFFCGYTTAQKASVESVTYHVNTDDSITLQCETHFSGGDSEIDQNWVFQGKNLMENTDIKAKTPLRYNVQYQKDGHDRVYSLTIPYPVQRDESWYQC